MSDSDLQRALDKAKAEALEANHKYWTLKHDNIKLKETVEKLRHGSGGADEVSEVSPSKVLPKSEPHLAMHKKHLNDMIEEREKLAAQIKITEDEREDLRKAKEQVQKERDELSKDKARQEQRLKELTIKNETLNREVDRLSQDNVLKQELTIKNDTLTREVERLRQDSALKAQASERSKADESQLQLQLSQARSEIERLRKVQRDNMAAHERESGMQADQIALLESKLRTATSSQKHQQGEREAAMLKDELVTALQQAAMAERKSQKLATELDETQSNSVPSCTSLLEEQARMRLQQSLSVSESRLANLSRSLGTAESELQNTVREEAMMQRKLLLAEEGSARQIRELAMELDTCRAQIMKLEAHAENEEEGHEVRQNALKLQATETARDALAGELVSKDFRVQETEAQLRSTRLMLSQVQKEKAALEEQVRQFAVAKEKFNVATENGGPSVLDAQLGSVVVKSSKLSEDLGVTDGSRPRPSTPPARENAQAKVCLTSPDIRNGLRQCQELREVIRGITSEVGNGSSASSTFHTQRRDLTSPVVAGRSVSPITHLADSHKSTRSGPLIVSVESRPSRPSSRGKGREDILSAQGNPIIRGSGGVATPPYPQTVGGIVTPTYPQTGRSSTPTLNRWSSLGQLGPQSLVQSQKSEPQTLNRCFSDLQTRSRTPTPGAQTMQQAVPKALQMPTSSGRLGSTGQPVAGARSAAGALEPPLGLFSGGSRSTASPINAPCLVPPPSVGLWPTGMVGYGGRVTPPRPRAVTPTR